MWKSPKTENAFEKRNFQLILKANYKLFFVFLLLGKVQLTLIIIEKVLCVCRTILDTNFFSSLLERYSLIILLSICISLLAPLHSLSFLNLHIFRAFIRLWNDKRFVFIECYDNYSKKSVGDCDKDKFSSSSTLNNTFQNTLKSNWNGVETILINMKDY